MPNFLWDNLFRRTSKAKQIKSILGDNILFKDLTARELKFVVDIVHQRHYRKGEVVFHQGEIGVGMYLIVEGTIQISVEEELSVDSELREHIIAKLIPGDFFGEISLVEEEGRRTATAKALETTTLLGLFKPDLLEIFDRNPKAGVKIAFRLAEVLGRRLVGTTKRVSLLEEELEALESGTANCESNDR